LYNVVGHLPFALFLLLFAAFVAITNNNSRNHSGLLTMAAILTWLRVQFAPAAKEGRTERQNMVNCSQV